MLKPYSDERFFQALQKAKRIIKSEKESILISPLIDFYKTFKKYRQRIPVKHKNNWLILEVKDIVWLQASGPYVEVKAQNKTHLLNETLKQLEMELDPDHFIRIHRSTIINLSAIASLEPYFNGEYFITLKEGSRFKLSRKYREKVNIIMGNG